MDRVGIAIHVHVVSKLLRCSKYAAANTTRDMISGEDMNYQTFGAFSIPLDDHGSIPNDLKSFRTEIDETEDGLRAGKGCYLFEIRTSGSTE